MKQFIHEVYLILGHLLAHVALAFWRVRDKLNPPEAECILFVAHPDDDALFFHTYIKEKKPYVVLMTTAFSLKRMGEFRRVMKNYGVSYRAYDLESRDERLERIERNVRECLRLKQFSSCATHNAEGEYGHIMHKRVHQCVVNALGGYAIPVLTPVCGQEIEKYSLPDEEIVEKRMIFQTMYKSQLFVLDEYESWFKCERLVEEKK